MILETLFSITLLIGGGHLVSTNLKLHHYSDTDYKDIFYLENNESITKNCTKHSELEDIQKKRTHHNDQSRTDYKVTNNYEKEILEETVKKQKS
tara:strand:+ start:115 stop:396 length:282 start_codon:yes stop_codon:yes gene_type:complete